MKYAQIVMGPAGTGKSTYCHTIQEHCLTIGRVVRVINLDPAAESFLYDVAFDIRDLISLDDVAETLKLGPNGGLIYCMEYLADNLEWLDEVLSTVGEDDYIIFDCPGQIELYSHVPVMKRIASLLQREGFNMVGVFLIDALYITDAAKLMSGCLTALTAMIHLELPHINVLTKCDLADKKEIRKFLDPDADAVLGRLHDATGPRYRKLNEAFGSILSDYSLVSFVPLDVTSDESVELVLAHVDNAMQYGEDMEPKEPHDEEEEDPDSLSGMAAERAGRYGVGGGGMGAGGDGLGAGLE